MAISGGLIATHHRVFQYLVKLFLTITRKESIELGPGLVWFKKVKMIFYYSLNQFLFGLSFFFLINSLTYLAWQNLLSIIGVYILAVVLGLIAFFAPSGLGVREGVLVLFLQLFFPLNVAILISLLARVWTTVTEVFLSGGFYLLGKVKK